MNFVIGKFAEQHQTFGQHELPEDFPCWGEDPSLPHLERPLLVVDLSSAVVTLGISFGDDKVFPPLVEVGLIDPLDVDALVGEGVPTSEIAAIDNPGQSHDPVGNPSKIFNKMQLPSKLLISGSS